MCCRHSPEAVQNPPNDPADRADAALLLRFEDEDDGFDDEDGREDDLDDARDESDDAADRDDDVEEDLDEMRVSDDEDDVTRVRSASARGSTSTRMSVVGR